MRYHTKLYRIAFAFSGDAAEAEDIVQDAYCKLWKAGDRLAKIENNEAYAVGVAKNICLDRIRSRRFTNHLDTSGRPDRADDMSPEAILQVRSEIDMVRTLIARLPDKQRLVIRLRGEGELDIDEIAELTGFSNADIRTTLFRARQTLKEEYRKLNGND